MPDRLMSHRTVERLLGHPTLVAGIILVTTLSATAWFTVSAQTELRLRAAARISRQVDRTIAALESRIATYDLLARGAIGMFAGESEVSHRQWVTFVDAIDLNRQCAECREIIAVQRSPDGVPSLLFAPSARADDPLADPVSDVELAGLALPETQPTFVIASVGHSPTIALYLIPATARRADGATMRIWIAISVAVDDMLDIALARRDADIGIELHEGTPDRLGPTLASAGDPDAARAIGPWPSRTETSFTLAGRELTVVSTTLAGFDIRQRAQMPRRTLIIGLLISGLATATAWSLARTRARALDLAEHMTVSRTAALTRLRNHLTNTPLGAIEVDRDFRVVDWNPAAEGIFGIEAEGIVGQSARRLFVDSSAADAFWTSVQNDGHVRVSAHNVRADGETVHCEWYVTPILDENDPWVGAAFLVDDMSEHDRMEERLRETQKMEAVGRLAGGVAHDFNNILTAILGYSDLAMTRTDEPGVASQLREIHRAAERAAGLTRQLLAFGRRQTFSPQVLDLNRVVRGAEHMLQRLIGEDITLVTDLEADLFPVRVDPGQVEQVIVNLAVNARDAMPSGGRLVVRTANEERLDKPSVVLEVSDDGVGMDESVLSHVFEPFFTTKEPGRGTGLGLATVYGIVRYSGGDVRVDSTPGFGTRVRITLPRAEGNAEVGSETTGSEPHHRGRDERILLVEDDPAVREIAQDMLETAGYKIFTAADAEQALELFEQHAGEIDLVVSDVLPGRSGPDMARTISLQRPDLPVLFMSGYPSDRLGPVGMADAEVDLLPKPFSFNALIERVAAAIARHQSD
jgi:PAS domain S-box-containing protein